MNDSTSDQTNTRPSSRPDRYMRWISTVVIELLILNTYPQTPPETFAAGEDASELYQMVMDGQGEAALQVVIEAARARGGWGPAPGDVVVFDPVMPPWVGGAVWMVDMPPFECANRKISQLMAECMMDFTRHENRVRVGRSMFVRQLADGGSAPRPAFDDLLAIYLEEVGHSWQEYLHETDGLGSGARTRQTSWEDSLYRLNGWEYQVKRYILSLDGSLLALSQEQRDRLYADICAGEGYANPLGRFVSAYGPPPGWPNPPGWLTAAPTSDELQVFCSQTHAGRLL